MNSIEIKSPEKEQPAKALPPINVMVSGITSCPERLSIFVKAPEPIEVILPSKTTVVMVSEYLSQGALLPS